MTAIIIKRTRGGKISFTHLLGYAIVQGVKAIPNMKKEEFRKQDYQPIELRGKTGFFESASNSINHLADNMAEIVALVKDAAGEVYTTKQITLWRGETRKLSLPCGGKLPKLKRTG